MKTIMVLGMHRSATSLIAKGLANEIEMGVSDPRVTPEQPHGHWENWAMVETNDVILALAGGTWDDPPSATSILGVANEAGRRITAFIQEYGYVDGKPREIWGFKDPRLCLTGRLWLMHLENPHLVLCARNPIFVAQSLSKRDKKPLADCYRLAMEYNRRAIDLFSWFTACNGR